MTMPRMNKTDLQERMTKLIKKAEGNQTIFEFLGSVGKEFSLPTSKWRIDYSTTNPYYYNITNTLDELVFQVGEEVDNTVDEVIVYWDTVLSDKYFKDEKNYHTYLVLKLIKEHLSLEKLCETLDSCHDLYDLGYIDSKKEQVILDEMAELSALDLWAIHKYVHTGNSDYEYPFNEFVNHIHEVLSK